MKLEVVADNQRLQKRIDTLQRRFPFAIVARSSFFSILGCYVEELTEEDKSWLQAMIDAQVIHRWRCKEREDH